MEASPERVFLEDLERGLERGVAEQPDAVLALIAGREIELDADELHGSQRRAVQLLAAAGDPLRGLDVDGRAVQAIADDLDAEQSREALQEGLRRLQETAIGLPHVLARIEALTGDSDLAWRWFAVTLLAEELSGE